MDIATGIVLKLVSSHNYILCSRKLLKTALYDLSWHAVCVDKTHHWGAEPHANIQQVSMSFGHCLNYLHWTAWAACSEWSIATMINCFVSSIVSYFTTTKVTKLPLTPTFPSPLCHCRSSLLEHRLHIYSYIHLWRSLNLQWLYYGFGKYVFILHYFFWHHMKAKPS